MIKKLRVSRENIGVGNQSGAHQARQKPNGVNFSMPDITNRKRRSSKK